jgi:hypothetical protein
MGRPTGFMGAPDPSTDNTRAVPAGTTVDYFFPKIATAIGVSDPATINSGVANALLATGQFRNILVVYNTTEPGWILNDWGQMHIIATTTVPFASLVAVANALEAGATNNFVLMQSRASFVDSDYVQLSPGPQPAADETAHGIETILQNPDPNADPDFDVIFSDGTSGIFDIEGNYTFGTKGGITNIDFSTDASGKVDGISANMDDGTEVYFDFNGNWVGTYDPRAFNQNANADPILQRAMTALLNSPKPGAVTTPGQVALNPATTGTYTAAQIQAMIADAIKKQGGAVADWFDANGHFNYTRLLNAIGLGAIPATLGFSAGAVVGGIAIGLYLLFNGLPIGGRRR